MEPIVTATQVALQHAFRERCQADERCYYCRKIDLDQLVPVPLRDWQPGNIEWHMGTVRVLSDRHHCPSCRFFSASLEPWKTQELQSIWMRLSVRPNFMNPPVLHLDYCSQSLFSKVTVHHRAKALPGYSDATRRKWPDRNLFARFVKPHSVDIDLVNGWLARCDRDHRCWNGGNSNRNAISRPGITLIDVQRRLLVKTDKLPHATPVRYAALSYVWGYPIYKYAWTGYAKTDSSALPMQPVGLLDPSTPLPRTVEDAISFTRSLGIPYLWVDALCIPQDDAAEKARQIRAMNHIFRDAYCTLIATGPDCHAGLPASSERTPRRAVQNAESLFRDPDIVAFENFYPSQLEAAFVEAGEGLLRYDIKQTAWDSRAWTLQEGILACRRIIFSVKQVYFACNLICESESAFSTEPRSTPLGPSVEESLALFPLPTDDLRDRFSHFYTLIVRELTGRDMGLASDALNAIQGILSHAGLDFVHALPVRYFGESLLWRSEERLGRSRMVPEGWRPGLWPSWTWLGKNCRVRYPSHDLAAGVAGNSSSGLVTPTFSFEDGRGRKYTLKHRGSSAAADDVLLISASAVRVLPQEWPVTDPSRYQFCYYKAHPSWGSFVIDPELWSEQAPDGIWGRVGDGLYLVAVTVVQQHVWARDPGNRPDGGLGNGMDLLPLLLVRITGRMSRRVGMGWLPMDVFLSLRPCVESFVLK